MVSVTIKKDSLGQFCGFTSAGHAGLAEKGYDIACAGISTLTFTAVLALQSLTTLKPKVHQNAKKALLECDWINEPTQIEKSELIIKVMLLGLTEIQKQFSQHLSICEVEV